MSTASQTPSTGKAQPADRFHTRTVNGGIPQLIPTRDALAEINHAMMGGKRAVREMSEARGHARIVYKDRDRGTVELRPATTEDKAAAILGTGEKWIRHDFQPGQGAPYMTVRRESALNLIAEHLRTGAKVYRSTEGGVKIEPTTGNTSYWLQPFPTRA
ncbi:hypothetical protein [Streptomyces sp. CL12-4]|uniref:hypothetical protein n=1 Tax=Streptomyces sp. CL12-4 TaxID=2810306 RepID=UPI001EFC279E|nr:hypothetical protein [Streptomyces sp. CL12-4]MCG8971832.1 hypothetical protein [Streptomyces sp. CL12-4]